MSSTGLAAPTSRGTLTPSRRVSERSTTTRSSTTRSTPARPVSRPRVASRAQEEYREYSREDASAYDNVLDLSELRRQRARENGEAFEEEFEDEASPRRSTPRPKKTTRRARSSTTTKATVAKTAGSRSVIKIKAAPRVPCAPCHWGLIAVTLLMALLSIPMVYSASQANALNNYSNVNYFLVRQIGFVGVGLALLVGASRLSGKSLRTAVWILYGVSILGLLAIELTPLGLTMGSTQRWLKLGPLQFQVSELAKVALIGVLADFWSRAATTSRGKVWHWFAAFGIVLPIVALVFKQPHLSAALVLITIPIIIGFYAGAPLKQFGVLLAGIAVIAAMVIGLCLAKKMPLLKPYQQERIVSFLSTKTDEQGAHYQSEQGLRAMERGGVLGVGPGASLYKQGHLPAPHTDFILAIIGEETGLVGMLFLLACYGAIIFFCFQIGHVAGKPFESLLCAGVGSLFAMQVLCNMSVVLNILPVTGMPLPLVSYGGSGLLCCLLALGLVLGISRQNGQDEKQDA